jgi:hypothetical protein
VKFTVKRKVDATDGRGTKDGLDVEERRVSEEGTRDEGNGTCAIRHRDEIG